MSKFYRNLDGTYKGEVTRDNGDDSPPPEWGEVVEVPSAPDHASQTWNGTDWDPYVPPAPPLIERLKNIFVGLDVTLQADLGPLASAVFMFLTQENVDAARAVIERATIPAELEPVRTQLLGEFPA